MDIEELEAWCLVEAIRQAARAAGASKQQIDRIVRRVVERLAEVQE